MHTSYSASGFGQSLGLGSRQALIMVDFARAYFEANSPLFANADGVRQAAVKLLSEARARRLPVIHTRVAYDPTGRNGGVFYRKIGALAVFQEGSALGEFAEDLEPIANEQVVTKQYASAFFGTSLASLLTSQGIDCVLIAGMSTSGCVRATGVDAIQHGFIPVIVQDCVGDRDEAPHRASLFDLAAKYADVRTSEDIFSCL
ncbi:isochorismatase family protein [Paraburkholderia aromaticivorans]|uniref:isochorismatase family protein n=1 Tax=Paraburkholderia aromaticivorans TaxID=2026199 RepID=UPI00197F542D|nr:isochorismatase family protein [Paraburkholderia aromaticivorans]